MASLESEKAAPIDFEAGIFLFAIVRAATGGAARQVLFEMGASDGPRLSLILTPKQLVLEAVDTSGAIFTTPPVDASAIASLRLLFFGVTKRNPTEQTLFIAGESTTLAQVSIEPKWAGTHPSKFRMGSGLDDKDHAQEMDVAEVASMQGDLGDLRRRSVVEYAHQRYPSMK